VFTGRLYRYLSDNPPCAPYPGCAVCHVLGDFFYGFNTEMVELAFELAAFAEVQGTRSARECCPNRLPTEIDSVLVGASRVIMCS